MSIPEEIIEKIRQSVDIVDVISDYVPLKRAGSYFKGLSPFNKEKTPSFMVSPSRQSFKCYSSGHGGDVFKFLMLYENISFPDAIRRLGEKAGIHVPEFAGEDKEAADQTRRSKETLLRLHSLLTNYWNKILREDKCAENARKYLKSRKIPLDWIDQFSIGYAPNDWEDTIRWAQKEKFTKAHLMDAGVIGKRESGSFYDRFRGRLIFPIHDEQGRPIAFSGRLIEEQPNTGKYINSPETIIFKKSKVLYGMNRAKRAILDQDRAIICEGQIDVLRCHSAGLLNVVAPLGTAFTEHHCRTIKRLTDHIILCLDADQAGQDTATRLGELILSSTPETNKVLIQAELGIQVIQLPEGQDPDSLITEKGIDVFKQLLEQSVDYLDFFINQHLFKERENGPSGYRRVVEATSKLVSLIPNAILRDQLTTQASIKLDVAEEIIQKEIQRQQEKRAKSSQAGSPEQSPEEFPKAEILQVDPTLHPLLQLILSTPSIIPEIQRKLNLLWVKDLPGFNFVSKLFETYSNDEWSDLSSLNFFLTASEQNYLAGMDLDMLAEVPTDQKIHVMDKVIRQLNIQHINQRMNHLSKKIKEGNLTAEEIREQSEEILRLTTEKSQLIKNIRKPV